VIWDVHESYLDMALEREWIPRLLKPTVRILWDIRERFLLNRCAGVIVVSSQIAARYHKLHRNVAIVSNYPDLSQFAGLPTLVRDGKTCVFAGGIGPNRRLLEAVAAIGLLMRRGLSVPLVLAGRPDSTTFLDHLLASARQLGVGELVTYQGVLTMKEAIQLEHRASIGLVLYPRWMGIPTKFAELLAAGLPVVYSDFPNFREFAGTFQAGLPVDPTSPERIADAIEYLVKNPDTARQMGENGRRAVRERFNWSIERPKLLQMYRDILGYPAQVRARADGMNPNPISMG
jgi:glycosyltransferase involved in cell wall biosynthesis